MSIIVPANTLAAGGGFDVANSCRFNIGSSDHLTRSLGGSPTSTRKATWSYWVKRSTLTSSASEMIYSNEVADDNNRGFIQFEDNDSFRMTDSVSSTQLKTNRLFRDVASFYHIVLAIDTTQGTAANRIKLYVNGVQETSFATASYPNQNDDLKILTGGQTNKQHISKVHGGSGYFGGYLSEFVFIDGLQLAPTSFGEFDEDSGIWKPIDVSGLTFGTNGFYLNFQTSAELGDDVSGNTNDFTENNLTAVDQSVDTCTNNFATLNTLDGVIGLGNSTFSEGNLRFNSETNGNRCWARSTIGVSSGKWYFEAKVQTVSNNSAIGITDRPSANLTNLLGGRAFEYSYQSSNGNKTNNGTGASYGDDYTNDDIVSCALDLDNLKIYFGKNGTFQNSGDPTSGSTGTGSAFNVTAPSSTITGFYFFALGDLTDANNSRWLANFGSPLYANSSGNADGNGFADFEFAPPSGYLALCTKNLAGDS